MYIPPHLAPHFRHVTSTRKPNGRYMERIEDLNTRKRFEATGTTAAIAQKRAIERMERLIEEAAAATPADAPRYSTVSDCADDWLATVRRSQAKPNTLASAIRYHAAVTAAIGHLDLSTLRASDISPHVTSSSWLDFLKSALALALADGIIHVNPAAKVRHVERSQERRPYDYEEVEKIIKAAKAAGQKDFLRWGLAITTGARQNEVLGLRAENIRTDEHGTTWIDIEHQAYRSPHGKPVKDPVETIDASRGAYLIKPKSSSSRRSIPVPETVAYELRQYVETLDPKAWLFGGRAFSSRGEVPLPLTTSADQTAWSKVVKAAGVEHLGIHCLRSTFATLAELEVGLPYAVVRSLMGHSPRGGNVTAGYQRATSRHLRIAAVRFDKFLREGPDDSWLEAA